MYVADSTKLSRGDMNVTTATYCGPRTTGRHLQLAEYAAFMPHIGASCRPPSILGHQELDGGGLVFRRQKYEVFLAILWRAAEYKSATDKFLGEISSLGR